MSGQALEGGDKKDDPFANLPKPGPEHKMLAKLAGNWTADIKAWFGPGEPKDSKGTMNRKMIMDGRYLQETFEGDSPARSSRGGSDRLRWAKKKYIMAWIDNMETGISLQRGELRRENQDLHVHGEENSPTMGKIKSYVLTIISDDEERFEMYRTPLKEKDAKEFRGDRSPTPKKKASTEAHRDPSGNAVNCRAEEALRHE